MRHTEANIFDSREATYKELGAVLAISIIAWLNSINAIMLFPYVMYSNDMLF